MNKTTLNSLFFIAFALLLTGCDLVPVVINTPRPASSIPSADPIPTPVAVPVSSSTADIVAANKLYQQGRKRQAANAYFAASGNHPSPQRERLILQAAEIAAMLPDTPLMQRFLAAINTSRLTRENRARYDYTQALIAMANNQPKVALDILPTNSNGLSAGLANKIRVTRLRATQRTGDHFIIAKERIAQDRYLKPASNQKNNRQQIWSHLSKLPKGTLEKLRVKQQERILRGWLDLAYLRYLNGLPQNLAKWRRSFSGHPATAIAATLDGSTVNAGQGSSSSPVLGGNVAAIMLPISGRMSPVGGVLVQGIMDAQRQSFSSTRLLTYDTGRVDANVLYNRAVKAGASFVLGPFSKDKLTAIASNGYLQTPVLSLNYLPGGGKGPANLFQFGLLPEDEAVQIAQLAMNNGQSRAAVLVPDTSWGRRLESAFSGSYTGRGGRVVDVLRYANQSVSYNTAVANLMNTVNDSIDMIFIAGSPTQARMVYPAVARQNIANKPVYATSHIFSGSAAPSLDANLNGIIYTEIPWVLANPTSTRRYPRLYALGQDSMLVAQNLEQLKKGGVINGKTGTIRYSRSGSLHRTLQWATFRGGIPAPYVP